MLFRLASAPSYTTIQAGVDPAKTGKITAALDQAGVSYKLANNGTAIAVVSGQESKARVALAGQGLAGGSSQPGFELLDKQKLGSSTFQQQIAYQRALEGQIAQTIGQIDGISGAQVQLTLPKDDLFADEKQPATAAVLLNADSSTLDPAAVARHRLAGLLQRAEPQARQRDDHRRVGLDAVAPGRRRRRQAARRPSRPPRPATRARMQATLGALIARTVGTDKAQVQVHADLNVDQSTQEKLDYAKKGTPIATRSRRPRASRAPAARAAAPPARRPTSRPTPRPRRAPSGNSNYKRTTGTTDYGVGKTVTHTKIAPGRHQQARRRAARRQVGPGRPGRPS